MAKATAARKAALKVLGQVRQRDAYARELLRSSTDIAALQPRDRALAERLVLGTVAAQGILDGTIDRRVRRPGSLEPRVRDALRLAVFELLYLETPERAAVSQGVESVRSVSPRAAGLANAVLRQVATDRFAVKRARVTLGLVEASDEEPVEGEPLDALAALVSGLPRWLCARVLEQRGPAALAAMALGALDPAPVWVAGGPSVDAGALLTDAGARPEPEAVPGTWRLGRPSALGTSGLVEEGAVVPSDLAAQTVALMAVPGDRGSLLEVGSGRGTKTMLVEAQLARLGWTADHVAVEVSGSKAQQARERAAAAGRAVAVEALDGRELAGDGLPATLDRVFSTVLVDAPCSGTGTARRHPEIPWALQEEALDPDNPDGLPALQLSLLRAAAGRVAPGGALLYATCSVLTEENEDVVSAFLASPEGSAFAVAPATQAPAVAGNPEAAGFVAGATTGDGFFRTSPALGRPDGHFCARLIREGSAA